MASESIIELQKIDCNCNNCIYLERNFDKYNKWLEWRKQLQFNDFEKAKNKAIQDAQRHIDNAIDENDLKAAKGNMRVALKMSFQFDKVGVISYGNCTKLNKEITFIPDLCQVETQTCFKHRKDK